MDRASELRALMKSKAAGGVLTGKDKAKYLKSLREEQKSKAVETKPVPVHVQPTSSHAQPTPEISKIAVAKQIRVVSIPALTNEPQRAKPSTAVNVAVPTANIPSMSSGGLGGLVGYDDDEDEDEDNGVNKNEGQSESNNAAHNNTVTNSFSSSGPPAGFFDEEPSSIPSADISNYNNSSKPIQPQQSKLNAADEYTGKYLCTFIIIKFGRGRERKPSLSYLQGIRYS